VLVARANGGTPVTEGQTAALPFPPPGIVRDVAPFFTRLDAGTLLFHFRVPGNGGAVVANGDPRGGEGMPSIAIWWPGPLGDAVYVLLDDGGGFNPGDPTDRDHDDMILRLTVRAVPEPGTFAMVGGGTALLGALARGRRRHATQRSRAER
jgi:hypothetical protein